MFQIFRLADALWMFAANSICAINGFFSAESHLEENWAENFKCVQSMVCSLFVANLLALV